MRLSKWIAFLESKCNKCKWVPIMPRFLQNWNFSSNCQKPKFLAITFYLHIRVSKWVAFLESTCNLLQNEYLLSYISSKIAIFHQMAKNETFFAITFDLHIRLSNWVVFLDSTCNFLQNGYLLCYIFSKCKFFIKLPKIGCFWQ